MHAKLRTRLRQKRALLRRSREGLAPYLEIGQIRERLDAVEGRLELLEDDLELIADNVDINNSMTDKIITADGTVGVGSTAPVGVGTSDTSEADNAFAVGVGTSDTSEADNAFAVGVGSTAPPVGVGSSAPAGTTHTDPDTSADGGQSATDPDFS